MAYSVWAVISPTDLSGISHINCCGYLTTATRWLSTPHAPNMQSRILAELDGDKVGCYNVIGRFLVKYISFDFPLEL